MHYKMEKAYSKLEKDLKELELKIDYLQAMNHTLDYQNIILPLYAAKVLEIYSEYFSLNKTPTINSNDKKA